MEGAQKPLSSWETPYSFPGFATVVTTLSNEDNLLLLAGEERAQAFSRLTGTGADLDTEKVHHTWETGL